MFLVIILIFQLLILCYSEIILTSLDGSVIIGRMLFTVFGKRPYAAFYRIPYAEPPIGDLRFKPPKLHRYSLNNIRDYSQYAEDNYSKSFNEDCLHLSIYMPVSSNATNKFPVLVFVYEDSNSCGPDFFIDEEVLVVNVSFRTSIFGFLFTGNSFAEGNMGAKDVLMALKWIRDNISVFRGDSGKVTVIGSGIGSTIVASLLCSTSADDLYARVIVLSGSALSPADYRSCPYETERKLYRRLFGFRENFNRDKFYSFLKTAPTKKLISATWNLFDSSEVRDNQRLINSFGCVVETSKRGSFMNRSPLEAYKQSMVNVNVDVMFGFTSLECLYKLEKLSRNRELLKCLNYNFQYVLPFKGRKDVYDSKRYKRIRQRIMDFYFLNGTIGERSLRRYAKYHSDQVIYPLLRQAILQSEASCNNVYLYRFGYKGTFNIGWRSSVPNLNWSGATSGDEICYLFRCKSVNAVYKRAEMSDERHFITKIVRLMANFVKYGNPTPTEEDYLLNTLKWKPLVCGENLKGMSLRQNPKSINLPEEKRMKFWKHLKEEFFSGNTIKDEL